ncbi:hypothetical protein SRHO_G00077530 [Serrasalmus rhombeus]
MVGSERLLWSEETACCSLLSGEGLRNRTRGEMRQEAQDKRSGPARSIRSFISSTEKDAWEFSACSRRSG